MLEKENTGRQERKINQHRLNNRPEQINDRRRPDIAVKLQLAHRIVVDEHDKQHRNTKHRVVNGPRAVRFIVFDKKGPIACGNNCQGIQNHQDGVNDVDLLLQHRLVEYYIKVREDKPDRNSMKR